MARARLRQSMTRTVSLLVLNGSMATLGARSSTSSANASRMAKEMADAVEESLSEITLRR